MSEHYEAGLRLSLLHCTLRLGGTGLGFAAISPVFSIIFEYIHASLICLF